MAVAPDLTALGFDAEQAASTELERRGAPGEVLAGDPIESVAVLWSSDGVRAGVWACTPGSWVAEYPKLEMFFVLEGRVTLRPRVGDPIEVESGGTCVVPAGWTGSWTVHEAVRKVWITTAPERSEDK
jgi:uncharacterized protein